MCTSTTACLLLSTFRTGPVLSFWAKFTLMLMGDKVSITHFCKKEIFIDVEIGDSGSYTVQIVTVCDGLDQSLD